MIKINKLVAAIVKRTILLTNEVYCKQWFSVLVRFIEHI